MKDKKKFFSVYIPVAFFMFFCQVISSSLVVAQTYYDDDTFYDTDYSEKEAVRREEAEIMSIPVDIPESGIKLTTDAVSESWRFFTKALVDEQNNDYESAMAGFKKTIENAPDNIYVYQHAAEIALDTGHYEDAAKWAEYLVQKDSSTAQNWVLFGNSRWAREQPLEAKAAYLKARKLDPDNTEALFQYAALTGEENPDEAMRCLEKYKKLKPEDSAEIDYRMAVLYNVKGNMPKTEEYLLRAVKENPYHAPSLYSLVELYEIKKDTASAMEVMETLAVADPGNVKLLKQIAERWMETDTDKADEYFRRIKKIDKSDSDACFWLAAMAEDNRDYAGAAKQLEESSSLWKQPELLMRLSYYYTQTDRYKEGVDLLEKAHEKFPDNDDISYYLALGRDDTGSPEKAYELLDMLARKQPDNQDYLYQLAQVCEKLDRIDEMEKYFKAFLAKSPDNASVLNYLGYSLADRNMKLEEAREYIKKAVSIQPDEGAFTDSLAWVEYRLGNNGQAVENIESAVEMLPQDPVIWEHYAEIMQKAGDNERAWKGYKIAYVLNMSDEEKSRNIYKSLKKIQKKLPASSAAPLMSSYFETFFPSGEKISMFGRAEAKVKGKNVKLDIMLSYDGAEGMTLTVLSPFYTPVWTGKLSGTVFSFSNDIPEISGLNIDREEFHRTVSLLLCELRAWYSGEYNHVQMKKWTNSYKTAYGGKVILNSGEAGFPREIRTSRNKKLRIIPGKYFLYNMYVFPGEFEFRVPFFRLKITLRQEKMNFSPLNDMTEHGDEK